VQFKAYYITRLIVQQHINVGLTKFVVSYKSCQMWSSLIMATSTCGM